VKIKIAQILKFDKKQTFDFELIRQYKMLPKHYKIGHCYVTTQHLLIPKQKRRNWHSSPNPN